MASGFSAVEISKLLREGIPWWPHTSDSASIAENTNSILGQGTKILHTVWSGQNIKIKIETKTLQCDYP